VKLALTGTTCQRQFCFGRACSAFGREAPWLGSGAQMLGGPLLNCGSLSVDLGAYLEGGGSEPFKRVDGLAPLRVLGQRFDTRNAHMAS
jgi:hypothetical protein